MDREFNPDKEIKEPNFGPDQHPAQMTEEELMVALSGSLGDLLPILEEFRMPKRPPENNEAAMEAFDVEALEFREGGCSGLSGLEGFELED